jgi:molecular chaperone IbpA
MRTFDFAPMYRSVVGFDRLAALLDQAQRAESAGGYPPYNIETVGDDAYRIEIAVAGFKPEELNVEVNDDGKRYLHRGLAERNFERRFQLADYVFVTDASLNDGLLQIALKRELPEQMKPRTIQIASGRSDAAPQGELIEGQSQAA